MNENNRDLLRNWREGISLVSKKKAITIEKILKGNFYKNSDLVKIRIRVLNVGYFPLSIELSIS